MKEKRSATKKGQLSGDLAKLQEQWSAAQLQQQRSAVRIDELENKPHRATGGRQEAWIERLPIPSFDVDQVKWPGFRRVFQELMV